MENKFAQWLRETGRKAAWVADVLRVHPVRVSHWRTGQKAPSLEQQKQLAHLSENAVLPEHWPAQVGDSVGALRQWLDTQNYTAEQVAGGLDVRPATVRGWLLRTCRPSPRTARTIERMTQGQVKAGGWKPPEALSEPKEPPCKSTQMWETLFAQWWRQHGGAAVSVTTLLTWAQEIDSQHPDVQGKTLRAQQTRFGGALEGRTWQQGGKFTLVRVRIRSNQIRYRLQKAT